MNTPTRDVIIGIVCVVLGCVVTTASVHAARRTRNWLFLICAAGGLAFVIGVVGQRVFPGDDLRRADPITASRHTPGAWDAGVQIPIVNISATPLATGGFLLAVVGLALVLFFEAVPEQDAPPPHPLAPLEDGDTV